MQVTIRVTTSEAEAMQRLGIPGVDGTIFTYDPEQVSATIAAMKDEETWPTVVHKLTSIASQLGLENTFFASTPEPEASAPIPILNIATAPATEIKREPVSETLQDVRVEQGLVSESNEPTQTLSVKPKSSGFSTKDR